MDEGGGAEGGGEGGYGWCVGDGTGVRGLMLRAKNGERERGRKGRRLCYTHAASLALSRII